MGLWRVSLRAIHNTIFLPNLRVRWYDNNTGIWFNSQLRW